MQVVTNKTLSQAWLKASVIGSIWASVEIILGSFLHNMRIPFTGMILSFIGVWLMISFVQVWKDRGLIWKAGIICALMKSISPSAIIMGPMIGIFTEALIMELFIFVLGRNIIGYTIGGALAVTSTLIHKLVSLLILYGFDFLKILYNLYLFGVKQIGLEQLSPSYMVAVITAIYILLGMSGAIGGYLTGRKYLKTRKDSGGSKEVILETGNQLFSKPTGHNYSAILLVVNMAAIIIILLLVNADMLIAASASAILYVSFCIIHYRNSLRRLRKISFWLTFFVITFAAAFLWNGFSNGAFFTTEGLLVGLRMNARAIILIIGFASISVELKNPVIKSILYHRGFASLYQSLSMAFSALPFIISNISGRKNGSRGIFKLSRQGLFSQAEVILSIFIRDHENRPSVVIVTGEVHEGKTTFTGKIIEELKEAGIKTGGFLALAVNDESGKRKGFDLFNLKTSERFVLSTDKPEADTVRYGPYYFFTGAIEKGTGILSSEINEDSQLVVVDEIGPVELSGKGWSETIDKLCTNSNKLQLWVVRRNALKKVVRKWNIDSAYIFDISSDKVSDAVNLIKSLVN